MPFQPGFRAETYWGQVHISGHEFPESRSLARHETDFRPAEEQSAERLLGIVYGIETHRRRIKTPLGKAPEIDDAHIMTPCRQIFLQGVCLQGRPVVQCRMECNYPYFHILVFMPVCDASRFLMIQSMTSR